MARELWLKKGTSGEVFAPTSYTAPTDGTDGPRIRCPQCRWEPGRDAQWSCACRYEWHTFDTGGVCPACGRVWTDTQCLRCEQWSPHLAWYDAASSDGSA